ncbi:hypothetical protein J1C67_16530 [Clostridium gasigenes]|uniref:hypothetical protein n=1 Tax=Clostridium gasigenes TaxID=94869 RepID=UPI001A9349DE|nr:hypothetical protein [Clostridium gasigenes]QSW19122.1 hypothetical protein J1C67_16530 [Clostridium gasigenes]
MPYFKTEEIESISLEKLQQMIRKTGQRKITPSFDKNDKGPSWDGFITIYMKEGSSSKKDISSRIPVQIKGTEVKKLSNKFKSFKIELSDLRNYLNDGGVIFFVVEVRGSKEEEYKIFYNSLLPIDIQCILDDTKENQKTTNVKLNSILGNDTNFYMECKNFELNKQNQAISQVKVSKTFEELEDLGIGEIEFLTIGHPLTAIGKKTYTYIRDEYNCLIPIREVIMIDEVVLKHHKELVFNSKKYFDTYEQHQNEDEAYISFGDKIVMKKDTIHIKQSEGIVIERLRTLEFVFDNISTINKNTFPVKTLEKFEILRSEKEGIEKLIRVCDRFNMDTEKLRLKDLTNDDYYFLDRLECVEYGSIKTEKIIDIELKIIPFLNKEIHLLKCIYEDQEVYYDYYSSDLNIELRCDIKNKMVKISMYSMIKCDSLLCENFSKDAIINSLERTKEFYQEEIGDYYTLLALELIKAWDISSKDAYIDLAKYILDFIKEDTDDKILEINKAQIEYRLTGRLNYKTIGRLLDIKDNTTDDKCKAAIYILLDDYEEFGKCYEKLTKDVKTEFELYPIYYIYTQREKGKKILNLM